MKANTTKELAAAILCCYVYNNLLNLYATWFPVTQGSLQLLKYLKQS